MAKQQLNIYGAPINYSGKVPCRCWRCGSRRTLTKFPEEYVRGWPKCKQCGWKVRVDKARLRGKLKKLYPDAYEKDSGKQCRCKGHIRMHPIGKVNGMYRCIHHEDVVIEKAMKSEGEINFDGECPF